MKSYLIDENIHFGINDITDLPIAYATDIATRPSDEIIWRYAMEKEMTIITKDFDFVGKIKIAGPPPKVIHLKTGNMKRMDFIAFIKERWPQIAELSRGNKLVTVYRDKIEYTN